MSNKRSTSHKDSDKSKYSQKGGSVRILPNTYGSSLTLTGSAQKGFTCVIISNMPFGVNEESIKKIFLKSGEIINLSFHYFPKT